MFAHSLRAFPWEQAPPVGACQSMGNHGRSARVRRPGVRTCLRKGCGRKYQARSWNQRYCQEPDCLRQVHRWQAARRQAEHRKKAAARARHAQAEKERRRRAKTASQAIENSEVAPARGHAAGSFFSFPYAIGRAATKLPRARSATLHASAVPPVARQFATSWIASVSGFLAAPWMDARNAPSSTGPRASTGPGAATLRNHRATASSAPLTTPPNGAGRQLSRCSGSPI
jgi:hypothetical protein